MHVHATRGRALLAVLVALAAVSFAGTAEAQQIPGVSATFSGPTPNPVPAGTSSAVNAQFFVSADVGDITVSVELRGAGSFGTLRLDPSQTTSELQNCVVNVTTATCTWDGESVDSPQTLAVFVDVAATAPPNSEWNLVAIADSDSTDPPDILANTQLFVAPPPGTTTLSGTVVTTGGAPVPNACIFVLTSPPAVFAAITGVSGNWTVTGLPDNYEFVVAAIPPFVGAGGPCNNNGPPPVPGPGELQPVFFDDIWIDLGDPDLAGGDPFTFAVSQGATVLSASTSGIESCLTTAPGDADPRPACIQAVATTTTSTAPPTTQPSTTAPATTDPATTTTLAGVTSTSRPSTTQLLPATGPDSSPVWLAAIVSIALGTIALVAARRPRARHERG